MSEWISTDSQEPDEDTDVLCTDGESVFIAWHHNSFWRQGEWDSELVAVTHWMPLPEPPKK